MEQLFGAGIWQNWFENGRDWFIRTVTDGNAMLQAGIVLMLITSAWTLARFVRPLLSRSIAILRVPENLHRLRDMIPQILQPVFLVLMIWMTIGLLHQTAPGMRTDLLRIMASLMSAWIVIRLGSTFIRNRLAARTLSLIAWSLAALNITDLLGPTVLVLDSLAFEIGSLRISLLTLIKATITLSLFLWAASAASSFLERRIRTVSELTPSVQVLIGKLLKFILFALAIIIALTSVGIDLSALALFSGALGVGLGFGLQKVVSNLVSGVIILMDKSIKPGDTIELGETFGWITSLGARFVSIVTRDGKEYLIPNEDFITQRVVNWSYSSDLVRLQISFGVSYNSDPHEVRRIASEAASKPDRVAKVPAPVCHLVGFGDSSLDFVLRFWIKDPRDGIVNIKGQVLLAVWDAFKENGISIPYPHRQLLIDQPLWLQKTDDVENH